MHRIGHKIDERYELEGILGSGGRGVVYRGRDLVLGRPVAVKLLRAELSDRLAEQRFRREARTAARLEHPSIVPIYDFGRSEHGAYLVMPRVPGESLQHFIETGGFEPDDVIEIGIQAADALVYSHARGVVHRDIKPGNLMVERLEDGRRVLLMGCSTGCTLGTLAAVAGAELAGVIHVSPNFALVPKALQWFVDLPGASTWGPWIAGRERVIEPISEAHDRFWTNRYPTRAIDPMVKALRAVRAAKLGTITAPALFLYCREDKIVSPQETERTRARWGGPTTAHVVTLGPEDDENRHVIAGDVMSPSQNDGVVDVMVSWARKAL